MIAYNDAFVMSAWSKANGVKNDEILFLSDDEAKFSKSIGWTLGSRTARYAIVIDKGTVVYAAKEEQGKLDVGSFRRFGIGVVLTGVSKCRCLASKLCLRSFRLLKLEHRQDRSSKAYIKIKYVLQYYACRSWFKLYRNSSVL